MRIEEEIQQKRFQSEYQKAHINVLFTAAWLSQQSGEVLRPFLHPSPVTVKELTKRMIDKMSNASRLVDKLQRKGLVERKICLKDRRRVEIRITKEGLELLGQASAKMDARLQSEMSSITEAEAQYLNDILDKMRG